MSNGIKHLFKHRARRDKSKTARLAASLAPLEERDAGVTHEAGRIVVDKNSHVPKEMMEDEKTGFLGMEPVVLVILGLFLCFIGFIAWKVSEMPLE